MSRRSLVRSVVAAVVVAMALDPIAAGGQEQSPGSRRPPDVVSQTTFVRPGETFELAVILDAEPGSLLTVEVYERVGSRSTYWNALAGDPSGRRLLTPAAVPIDTITSPSGITTVTIATQSPDGITISESGGVHPVVVEVTAEGDDESQQLVTFLIALPTEPGTFPLRVATIVPFSAPLASGPDGSVSIDAADESRLTSIAASLERTPAPAVSLLPRPETLWALSRSGSADHDDILDRLRGGVATREVLASPFVALDPVRWIRSGQTPRFDTEIDLGRVTIDQALGVTSTLSTWIAAPTLDELALEHLTDIGVERIIADERRLDELDIDVFDRTLTQPFEVVLRSGASRGVVDGAQIDQELAAYLDAPDDPELAVHHLIADLAVLYLDSPGVERGAVVMWPEQPLPDTVLDAYLEALDARPDGGPAMLSGVTTAEIVGLNPARSDPTDAESPVLTRELDPIPAPSLPDVTSALDEARIAITSYLEVMDRPETAVELDALIHLSTSDELDADRRDAYLGAIIDEIIDGLTGIGGPDGETINLTARETVLELEFTNDQDAPATVLVRFASEKLDFPDGRERIVTLDASGPTTVPIRVRSRSAGGATLEIEILSPDQRYQLDDSQVVVRSTVVSGVGLIISALAIVFLSLWWGREIRRGRRDKRAAAAAGPDGPGSATVDEESEVASHLTGTVVGAAAQAPDPSESQ